MLVLENVWVHIQACLDMFKHRHAPMSSWKILRDTDVIFSDYLHNCIVNITLEFLLIKVRDHLLVIGFISIEHFSSIILLALLAI